MKLLLASLFLACLMLLPTRAQTINPGGGGGGSSCGTGSGNKICATPADGTSGASALRAAVAADIPVSLPAVNAGTATALAPGAVPPCNDVGGSHLNSDGTTFSCGTSTGSFPKAYLSWTAGAIADGACATQTFNLLGAALNDVVSPGWPVLAAGLFGMMSVSAGDVITVRLCNLSGASITVAALTYSAADIK